MSDDRLNAFVFVDARTSQDKLARRLAQVLHGSLDDITVRTSAAEIWVEKNGWFNRGKRAGPDGWLHYRFVIEVEAAESARRDELVALVSRLLTWLWQRDFPAVAECSFENELPRRGGYVGSYYTVVRCYGERQRALLDALRRVHPEFVREPIGHKGELPETLKCHGETWRLRPHGLGVCFEAVTTGEMIDAHVGMHNESSAFDAWRLCLHCESIGTEPQEHDTWVEILNQLLELGMVRECRQLNDHFTAVNDPECRFVFRPTWTRHWARMTRTPRVWFRPRRA